jgi:hypothetical protein
MRNTIIVVSVLLGALVALAQGNRNVATLAAPADGGTFAAYVGQYNAAYVLSCSVPACYKTSAGAFSEPDCAKDYLLPRLESSIAATGGGGGTPAIPGRWETSIKMGNHNRLAVRQADGGAAANCQVYVSIQ